MSSASPLDKASVQRGRRGAKRLEEKNGEVRVLVVIVQRDGPDLLVPGVHRTARLGDGFPEPNEPMSLAIREVDEKVVNRPFAGPNGTATSRLGSP